MKEQRQKLNIKSATDREEQGREGERKRRRKNRARARRKEERAHRTKGREDDNKVKNSITSIFDDVL
jgi:hypothetical protein